MERREALLFRSFFTEGIVDAYTLRVSGFPEKLRRYVMPAMADFFSGPRELYDGKGSKARKAVIFLTVALALIHVAVAAVICGPDTLPVAVVIAFMAFMASRALSSRNVPAPALLFMVFFFTILGFSYVSFLSSVVPSAIAIAETVSFLTELMIFLAEAIQFLNEAIYTLSQQIQLFHNSSISLKNRGQRRQPVQSVFVQAGCIRPFFSKAQEAWI